MRVVSIEGHAVSAGAPAGQDGGEPLSTDDDKLVLETLKDLCEQEVARADKIRSGARQSFAFAAGLFTLAQTVAFTRFNAGEVGAGEARTTVYLALIAGALVFVCGICMLIVDSLWSSKGLTPDIVLDVANRADESGSSLAAELSGAYATITEEHHRSNEERKGVLFLVQGTAVISAIMVFAELATALLSRT